MIWRSSGRVLLGVLLALVGASLLVPGTTHAQPGANAVYIVQIRDVIDLGVAPYLARVLGEARQHDAQAVILEINTPGGRLDAVLQMRDAILATPVRTIAFVNREAFSAGALVAIAANEIYMAPGAVMGAATPVDQSGVAASEKTISAVRATFRATAEQRGRDPQVAEAMVDPAVEIPGLVGQGQLLTLTTGEAQDVGYVDGVATSRQELLAAAGLSAAVVQETAPGLAESLVRLLTHPLLASLLVGLGLLMIYIDILSEGFGLIGGVGLGLLALFFWGHMLAGLAGWEGVALVLAGLALLGVEAFVIPGFGIAGILGIVALLGGLFISLIGGEIITNNDLLRAGTTVSMTFLFTVAGIALLLRSLPRAARLQGLILQSKVGAAEPLPRPRSRAWRWLEGPRLEAHMPTVQVPAEGLSLHRATGVAISALRPGGIAEIDGERVDVISQGDYIPAGEPIEVIADEGYRRVVRRLPRDIGATAHTDESRVE